MHTHSIMSKEEKIQLAFEAIQLEADKRIIYTFYVFLPVLFAMGAIYKQPVLALVGCMISSGVLYFALQYIHHRPNRNRAVTGAFIIALIFLQLTAKGITEAKYSYFIFLSVIALYRDRNPIAFLTIIALLYQIAGYSILLSDNVFGIYIKDHLIEAQSVSVNKFLFSVLFVCLAFVSAIMLVDTLYKESISSIQSNIEKETELQNYAQNLLFADEIAAGNLEAQYVTGNTDSLGRALINMRDNLKKADEKDEQDRFISDTTAEVGELLRKNTQDIVKLTDEVLAKLIQALEASQGAIYLTENHNDEVYLEMIACYAYNRKKFLHHRVGIGEGLIGQTFLEALPTYLTHIPPQYKPIDTGMGEITPSCIFIAPLKANNNIVGVLEIASLHSFKEHEKRFLENVTNNIANTLVTARNHQETQNLYKQSQIATEELRTREEEMRQNMEELKTTQEEMQRTQTAMQESQMKSKAIFDGSINSIIIFNEDGWIEEVNPSTTAMFGYDSNYINNMKIENLFAEFADGFQPFIGLRSRLTAKKRNGETFHVQSFLNRFVIGSRNIMLIYSRDATKEVAREKEVKIKIQQLEFAVQTAEDQARIAQAQVKKLTQ